MPASYRLSPAPGAALDVADPIAFSEALSDWMRRAGGRFSVAYPSPSPAWYTDPAYLEQLQAALSRAINGRGPGKVAPGAAPETVRVTAELAPNAATVIIAPRSKVKE